MSRRDPQKGRRGKVQAGVPATPRSAGGVQAGDPLSRLAYYQEAEWTASLAGMEVRVISKPPLASAIGAAIGLLAEAVDPAPNAQVLLLGTGPGVLAVSLARRAPTGRVRLMDVDVVALHMAERTLQANQIHNAGVESAISVLPHDAAAYDLVVMQAPPNRKLARRWLVEAHTALREGGALFLAGANEAGIQSIIDDAGALFGDVAVLGYKSKQRMARARKATPVVQLPPWAVEPGIAPDTWHVFDLQAGEEHWTINSLPGIFSYDRLDEGTRLLLQHMPASVGARVLDLGCGYGILGLVAARGGAARVDLVDTQLLAVAAAQRNIAAHKLDNARALPSDALAAVHDQRYDLVVSNPPFHVGKDVSYDVAHTFIEHARYLLNPGGRLVLVANRFIRYDHVMRAHFGTVTTLAETRSFHVLQGA